MNSSATQFDDLQTRLKGYFDDHDKFLDLQLVNAFKELFEESGATSMWFGPEWSATCVLNLISAPTTWNNSSEMIRHLINQMVCLETLIKFQTKNFEHISLMHPEPRELCDLVVPQASELKDVLDQYLESLALFIMKIDLDHPFVGLEISQIHIEEFADAFIGLMLEFDKFLNAMYGRIERCYWGNPMDQWPKFSTTPRSAIHHSVTHIFILTSSHISKSILAAWRHPASLYALCGLAKSPNLDEIERLTLDYFGKIASPDSPLTPEILVRRYLASYLHTVPLDLPNDLVVHTMTCEWMQMLATASMVWPSIVVKNADSATMLGIVELLKKFQQLQPTDNITLGTYDVEPFRLRFLSSNVHGLVKLSLYASKIFHTAFGSSCEGTIQILIVLFQSKNYVATLMGEIAVALAKSNINALHMERTPLEGAEHTGVDHLYGSPFICSTFNDMVKTHNTPLNHIPGHARLLELMRKQFEPMWFSTYGILNLVVKEAQEAGGETLKLSRFVQASWLELGKNLELTMFLGRIE